MPEDGLFWLIAFIAALASIANLARFMVTYRNGRRWFNLWLGLVSGYMVFAYAMEIVYSETPAPLTDAHRLITAAVVASYLGFALADC